MPNQNRLSIQILDVLKEASSPLMAKNIAASLCHRYHLNVTKKDVNPVLYGTLAAQVKKDGENRWSLAGEKETTPHPLQPEAGRLPRTSSEVRHAGADGSTTSAT